MKLIKKVAIIGFATFALGSTVAFGDNKPAAVPADSAAKDSCQKSTSAQINKAKTTVEDAKEVTPATKSGKTDT